MNFEHMPELTGPLGYLWAIGPMIPSAPIKRQSAITGRPGRGQRQSTTF